LLHLLVGVRKLRDEDVEQDDDAREQETQHQHHAHSPAGERVACVGLCRVVLGWLVLGCVVLDRVGP